MRINNVKDLKIIRTHDRTDLEYQKKGAIMIEIEKERDGFRVTVNGNESRIFGTVSEAANWASCVIEGRPAEEDPEAEK